MKNYLVGTFHKTGSVWMMHLIYEFTQITNYNFITVAMRDITENDVDGPRDAVLFDFQSIFSDPLQLTTGSKGFVVIRNPKDQIISATRYHMLSSEEWLHEPRPVFNGRTYQEMINSLDTWEDQLLFEMRNASRYFTNQMGNFNDPRFIKIKYEDLVSGYPNPSCIEDISAHLGFTEFEKESFYSAYQITHMENSSNAHIIDGSVNQWETLWPESLNNGFQRLYGNIEERLGY
jgi:hypothetical protein